VNGTLDRPGAAHYERHVSRLAYLIATACGVGRFPVAPGTAGSLLALPLLLPLAAMRDATPAAYALVLVGGIAVAMWAAGRACRDWNAVDDGRVVVDELAGMAVGGLFVAGTWTAAALVFLLFRLFDVWKPVPIRQLEKRLPGGLGVVADDLLAGVYAGVCARVLLSVA
jgi:phosphatidylglycerophosphatase A